MTSRWLDGRIEAADAARITTAFLLESAITVPSIKGLLQWSLEPSVSDGFRIRHLRTKEQVRDCIMGAWQTPSLRARELFERFREIPESFFPTTPVDMVVATGPHDSLLAMVRYKNLFRVADKVARRAAQRLLRDISAMLGADSAPAAAPSELSGLPVFALALEEVNRSFLSGRSVFSREDLRVDDAIGAKLVLSESDFDIVEQRLATHPNVLSVTRREHHGNYNDVHLLAEVRCPPREETIDRLRSLDWRAAEKRGLNPRSVVDAIPEYVETGSETFFLEVLLTTMAELVESEFGRGIHEERILRQRLDPIWNGRVATNVLLTTLSVLLLALAPTASIDHVPVKMSGRYLPETALVLLLELFGLDIPRSPLWGPGAEPGVS